MNNGNLIRREEARDFKHLFQLLEKMDKIATKMVKDFLDQLQHPEGAALKKIMAADRDLDELEIIVNEEVIAIISRWQPVANDLRMMMAAIKIATAFERIGDYIHSNSNKIIFSLENGLNPKSINIKALGNLGVRIVALMSLVSQDIKNHASNNAEKIMAEDFLIDKIYGELYRESLQSDGKTPIAGVIKTVMIAKYLERIGDQLRNIAEALLYATEGKLPLPERGQF